MEEVKRKMSFGNKASRALSFKSRRNREAAPASSGGGEGERPPELRKAGSSGGILRSISFNKRGASGESGAPSPSFKRAESAEPAVLDKSASEGVAKAAGGEDSATATAAAAAGEAAPPELKKGGLMRSLSFKRAASKGVLPKETFPAMQEPKKGVGGLLRTMSFSKQKAEAKSFVQKQKAEKQAADAAAADATGGSAPSASAPSGLVRKLSFGRKKA